MDFMMTLALALSVLTLGVCVALILRAGRGQHRLAEELRAARLRAQCVDQLLDVWQWQSDSEHRIVSMRPPHGAPASAWSDASSPVFMWELFGTDDDAALRAQLNGAAPLDDIQVQRKAASGTTRTGLLRGRTVTDASGQFAGYHGTLRDLAASATAPAAAPQEARVASASAPATALNGVRLNGAAAASESEHESFSFTVSHDLRAPIRVVEGFTRIVKEDYGRLLDRVGNDHLDRVLAAAARMNNMIDALLVLSKLSSQPLARQPVNLSQLAGYVADDLRRQWPDREVQIEIEPGMQVQGDPTLLREVVENLLGNAWKYTGKATLPSIAFERCAQGEHSFTVRDNGAGFDMRFADRLFGVFQRLHSANDFPGTGVGLASVRRIVRRHGGEIWGEAEVNRGARFHFSLPQGGETH
jgi:signal transduction histidine kinase